MNNKPAPRQCYCDCGGTTKGGRFLPGHDAKFVSWHLARVQYNLATASEVLAIAPTPALHNKLVAGLRKLGWSYDADYARWLTPSGEPEVVPAYLNK